jgi:hypothetical protein
MRRFTCCVLSGLALLLGAPASAMAQSYGAPGSTPPAAAPTQQGGIPEWPIPAVTEDELGAALLTDADVPSYLVRVERLSGPGTPMFTLLGGSGALPMGMLAYSVAYYPEAVSALLESRAAALVQGLAAPPLPPGALSAIHSDVLVLPRFPWTESLDEIDAFGRRLLAEWSLPPAPDYETLELPPPPVGEASRAFAQRRTGERGPLSTVNITFLRNGMRATMSVTTRGSEPPLDEAVRLAQIVDSRLVALHPHGK